MKLEQDKTIFDFYQSEYEAFYKIYGPEDEYQASGRGLGTNSRDIEEIFRDISEKLNFLQDDIVLDLGSGSGLLTMRIKDVVKKVYAFDGSEAAINILKRKLNQNSNVECLVGNITASLPYDDRYFSKIVSYSVFHYLGTLENTKKVLNEVIRVLKPNGVILIGDLPIKFHMSGNSRKAYLSYLVKMLFRGNIYLALRTLNNFIYSLPPRRSSQKRSLFHKVIFFLLFQLSEFIYWLCVIIANKERIMGLKRKRQLKRMVEQTLGAYHKEVGHLEFDDIFKILESFPKIRYQLLPQKPSLSYSWERMDLIISKDKER
ncbi:MAG: class I SAM-dependent methyltransferase [Candidatus Omnitrophica bacterium]|jgi:ubiquinone/menaquinone biosynthesis C-methylase UbiE|nr:class I SAM-dependent methyltransferase [Candidatus Omnitrophota bacterium]